MNDNLKFLLGLGAGAVVGYTLALLVAPEEGKKLRKKILAEADRVAKGLIEEGMEAVKQSKYNIKDS
jgi:gas vesicle protein